MMGFRHVNQITFNDISRCFYFCGGVHLVVTRHKDGELIPATEKRLVPESMQLARDLFINFGAIFFSS